MDCWTERLALPHNGSVPKLAKPAGSDDSLEPVGLLGNLVRASILRYLRAHPNVMIGAICDALQLGPTTVRPRLDELESAGLVVADPPMTDAESRRGMWVRYRTNDEAVTDLYLRLGNAIGEFAD